MANKKFIGKAKKEMERKGTVGSFTAYCGGRVTQSCIDRALKSDDQTLRRRAQFAANMRGIGSRKGREGIRKQREEMFLGGALEKVGGALTSDKFAGVASAAGGVGGFAKIGVPVAEAAIGGSAQSVPGAFFGLMSKGPSDLSANKANKEFADIELSPEAQTIYDEYKAKGYSQTYYKTK